MLICALLQQPAATPESADGRGQDAAQQGAAPDAAAADGAAPGPGDSPESRQQIAEVAAAASSWHTPAFTAWKTLMGSGSTVRGAPPRSAFVSDRFQWLPADVLVGADGRVVFDSYVNNLHPERHAALYGATAQLLERAVPLFERTLASSARPPQRVVEMVPPENPDWDCTADEMWEKMRESGEAEECRAAWRIAAGQDAAGGAEVDDTAEFANEIQETWLDRRQWTPSTPGLPETFQPLPPPPAIDLRSRRLQVIVKYAEIVLTPEQPRYGGGVWHVEGMENEAIVASCIAYLAADNLSESRLHFRTMVTDLEYEQDGTDDERLRLQYGIVDEGTMNEPLGSVLCAPGRMLCWPNAFQHRVAPFELADPSRPGIRKFAVLFLVDPRVRVISTRDVPPQQLAWHDAESRLGSVLPGNVKRKVDELRKFPMSLERAQALRLHLMNERKYVVQRENWEVYERSFTLCEH